MNSSDLLTDEATQQNRELEQPYSKAYWIVCVFSLNAFLAVILYMLFNLIRYALIVSKEPGNKLRGRRAVLLYYICVFSVIMAFLRNVCNQIVAFHGWHSDFICQMSVGASYVLYALCLFSVFFFLWLRQNMFYKNPLLTQIINPVAIIISWFSLIILILGGLAFISFHINPIVIGKTFAATPTGCRDVSVEKQFIPSLLIYSTVFTHILLLLLLAYPLLSHSTRPYSCHETKPSSSDSCSSHSSDASGKVHRSTKYHKSEEKAQRRLKNEQGRKVMSFLQKTCFFTTICVGANLLISSTHIFIGHAPERIKKRRKKKPEEVKHFSKRMRMPYEPKVEEEVDKAIRVSTLILDVADPSPAPSKSKDWKKKQLETKLKEGRQLEYQTALHGRSSQPISTRLVKSDQKFQDEKQSPPVVQALQRGSKSDSKQNLRDIKRS